MVRTRECDFCGDDIEPGTGTMFVRVDGSTEHFCSAKCERAAEKGREPRNVGWTEAGRQAAQANQQASEADAAEASTDEASGDDLETDDESAEPADTAEDATVEAETADDAAEEAADSEDDLEEETEA